jgi:hypothetical protein
LDEGIPHYVENCQPFAAMERGFGERMKASASIHIQGAKVTCLDASSPQYTSKIPSFHENRVETKVLDPTL